MLKEESESINVVFARSALQHGFHEYRFARSRCLRCIPQPVGPHDIVVEALLNTQTIEITNGDLVYCTAAAGFGSLQKPRDKLVTTRREPQNVVLRSDGLYGFERSMLGCLDPPRDHLFLVNLNSKSGSIASRQEKGSFCVVDRGGNLVVTNKPGLDGFWDKHELYRRKTTLGGKGRASTGTS